MSTVVLTEFMNLGMTVMATGNAVIGTSTLNLLVLYPAVFKPLILESGLQESAAATAAEIVGFVGRHINKVFFADHGLDHEPQIVGNRITVALANDLAGVLDRELDF